MVGLLLLFLLLQVEPIQPTNRCPTEVKVTLVYPPPHLTPTNLRLARVGKLPLKLYLLLFTEMEDEIDPQLGKFWFNLSQLLSETFAPIKRHVQLKPNFNE